MTSHGRTYRTAVTLLAAACAAVTMLPRAAAQDARDPAGGIDAIRPGDRIVLYVEGEKWPNDTFTVREGPAIDLPEFGHVSLAGVDKSEIQEYLKGQLGKYLKTPVLRARVLVRVGILGELTRPGFYNLPADALVSDALTAAGPTNNSRMAKATVVRAGATVMKSDSLNRAIAAGLTLGQVGLQSGDDLMVPRIADPERVWRIIAIVVTIPAAILTVIALKR